jgi:hypothetical protein
LNEQQRRGLKTGRLKADNHNTMHKVVMDGWKRRNRFQLVLSCIYISEQGV